MKTIQKLSICLIALCAIGGQVCVAQEPEQTYQEPETIQESEQEQKSTFEEDVIELLQRYQNVDPQLAEECNKTYLLTLKNTTPEVEIDEEAKSYFLNNIVHIDEVVNQGIALIKEGKSPELLTLLDSELLNFYSHPHNTVDNEIRLHTIIAFLYYLYGDSFDEFVDKSMAMDAMTIMHIEASGVKHPDYGVLLMNLAFTYIDIGRYDEAIACGEKLVAHYKEEGSEDAVIYSSLILANAYNKAGNKKMSKKIHKSAKHHPLYKEYCEEIIGSEE